MESDASVVDFGQLIPWKSALLDTAFERSGRLTSGSWKRRHQDFQAANSSWLDDFALFMALKEEFDGAAWIQWPGPLRRRDPHAMSAARRRCGQAMRRHSFTQMLFFEQWAQLTEHAHRSGLRIMGDVPIFAAGDSADVWSHPELFCVDDAGMPTLVSGVPPDYFSPTGQLWGNPLYDWNSHRATGYRWWIERIKALLRLVDLLRLDHFRGFSGYWEIPVNAPTAEKGRWAPGPAQDFLDALKAGLAGNREATPLPIVAEDLGVATPDVARLLSSNELPGMRVLQFGFAGLDNDFLPHRYPQNCFVYTGTHDNDTSRGWFEAATDHIQQGTLNYLHCEAAEVVEAMIEALWSSEAMCAIVPIQDLLGLGNEARMNLPGKPDGNWQWRLSAPLGERTAQVLVDLNSKYGRRPSPNRLG